MTPIVRIPFILSIAFAAMAFMAAAPAAESSAKSELGAKRASFHVFINPRKDSGHPWHGPGDLFVLHGKMVTHFPEAPGAVLCIVTPGGKASCPGQREAEARVAGGEPSKGKAPTVKSKKPASPCPSSYDCEFDEVALPSDDVFAIVVIDPAMAFTNLVDAVILMRKPLSKKDPAIVEFDKQLRDATNSLAPPGPFEAKRRLRPFQIRTLDECSKSCKLTQSEITIDLD